MKDGKTRAACYVRTSTDREEQEGSFQLQKDYFINMIKDDPELELVDCYGDYGKSGVSAAHRPEFQRMIRDCEEHKIDVIYTKSVSRFARNISDLVETIQHLRELGVSIFFEKESLNTMERSSELFLHILGIIAQEESRSFGSNVRLGLAVRMATGHPVGKTPYGFRRVDKDANWVIEENEAKRMRLAFRMAASGSCYADILTALNNIEKQEKTGLIWKKERLRRVLHNVAYKGDVLTGKTCTINGKKGVRGDRVESNQQYYLEGHHDPIVTPELFDRVQDLMEQGLLHSMRNKMSAQEKAFIADESWRDGQDKLEKRIRL